MVKNLVKGRSTTQQITMTATVECQARHLQAVDGGDGLPPGRLRGRQQRLRQQAPQRGAAVAPGQLRLEQQHLRSRSSAFL